MAKISEKIVQIVQYLEELKDIAPSDIEEYKSNLEKKAACERYIEKIMEAVTDLAFLIIKLKRLKIPEDDIDAFNILCENKLISATLASKLKNAKGMRNIISHQYGSIDDNIVFESITEELENDVTEFIHTLKKIKGLS